MSCPICLENISNKETTTCNHDFCKGCIDKWLEDHSSCPLCRHTLKEEQNMFRINFGEERTIRHFPQQNENTIEFNLPPMSASQFMNSHLVFDFTSSIPMSNHPMSSWISGITVSPQQIADEVRSNIINIQRNHRPVGLSHIILSTEYRGLLPEEPEEVDVERLLETPRQRRKREREERREEQRQQRRSNRNQGSNPRQQEMDRLARRSRQSRRR